MAIKFNGSFEVKRTPDEVYDFLTDPNRFAALLPDFQGLSVQDSTHFTVKVNVGISYIKGTADVKMELAQADRPKRAQYKGQGSMAGGNVSLTAGFDLSAIAGGTKVDWQGEAQIFGRLMSVAGGLLEPLGKKQVQKLIDGLQACVDLGNMLWGNPGVSVTKKDGAKNWVGQALPRKEENRLLRGRGKFSDDIKLREMLYLRFVRSPYAHAKIVSIDTSPAEALPGVFGAITGAEIVTQTQPFIEIAPDPGGKIKDYPLAVSKVRYQGEPVVV